jgi:predicted transcriptional regulator
VGLASLGQRGHRQDRSTCQFAIDRPVTLTIDRGTAPAYTSDMEVSLSPDVQSKLAQIAAERGRDPRALAAEAIERFVDYDAWFVGEVEKGLAEIDRHQVLTHEEVGARVEKLLAEKQRRA